MNSEYYTLAYFLAIFAGIFNLAFIFWSFQEYKLKDLVIMAGDVTKFLTLLVISTLFAAVFVAMVACTFCLFAHIALV